MLRLSYHTTTLTMTIDPAEPLDLKWLILLDSKNVLISLQAGASHDHLASRLIDLRKQEALLMGKERLMLDPYLWRILINRLVNRKNYEVIDTIY